MPTRRVQEFISRLSALQTEMEFRQTLSDALSDIGYAQFSYVGVDLARVRGHTLIEMEPTLIHFTNRPDWGRRYIDGDYGKNDPVMRECFSSRLPIRWTEAFMADTRTRKEARVMEDAWENGIRQGYTLPLYGPGGEIGLLMMSCAEKEEEFFRLTDEYQYDIHVMAYYFHHMVHKALYKSVSPPINLTTREVEILQLTAYGKTAREISSTLAIAERTVNFHLRNLMGKLGVRNKAHAVLKALSLDLFQD